MNWFDVLLMGLATWRISSIVANEDGPYEIFKRLRLWAGEYVQKDYVPTSDEGIWTVREGERNATTPWGKGLVCIFCVSVWIGSLFLVLFLLRSLIGPIHLYIALPFALSALAVVINKIIES